MDRTKIKRFYVGARHIGEAIGHNTNATCTRFDLLEAISEAKERIHAGDMECAVVVEIVAVVRRELPPLRVDILDLAHDGEKQ